MSNAHTNGRNTMQGDSGGELNTKEIEQECAEMDKALAEYWAYMNGRSEAVDSESRDTNNRWW